MENTTNPIKSYSFLADELVEKHFAEINLQLLSGKHIDIKNYNLFTVLEEKEGPISNFYKDLYNLHLRSDYFDGKKYFYLDFFDTGKGRFSDSSRYKELTALQTLIGLALLDMYYKRFFDEKKILRWTDITKLILEGEHRESYKKIFFYTVRESDIYDEKDWEKVKRKFNSVIDYFDKIGWVDKLSLQNEELLFEIRPAMNRLAKMYESELADFTAFVKSLKKGDNQ